ncbi:hypothetical protein HAX54_051324 [Datura stramonium]|uniref:Uncharacterized protein n=1 Tax=Datura stramonium TaxID=4076 RepID=A0ABS8SY66_DATST|nr:hypothetical protein [Datura stramonium]
MMACYASYLERGVQPLDSKERGVEVVLVRASCPILLPDIIGRSSSETRARNALFCFVPVLHFFLLESKGDFPYLESFCGVPRLLFFRTFFFLSRDRSAKPERARRRKDQTLRPNGNEQRRNEKMRCLGYPHFFDSPGQQAGGVLILCDNTTEQVALLGGQLCDNTTEKAALSCNILWSNALTSPCWINRILAGAMNLFEVAHFVPEKPSDLTLIETAIGEKAPVRPASTG